MSILSLAFTFFLLMDPVGNIPLFVSMLRKYSPQRQRRIILRELLIALFIIVLFNFIGSALLDFLKVSQETVLVSGGLILFIIALKMIFPSSEETISHKGEPFIVPLAVPLMAGPAILASVMIYTHRVNSTPHMLSAILIAWGVSLILLLGSTYLQKVLGDRFLTALERLMGLILTLLSVQMFLEGFQAFLK